MNNILYLSHIILYFRLFIVLLLTLDILPMYNCDTNKSTCDVVLTL